MAALAIGRLQRSLPSSSGFPIYRRCSLFKWPLWRSDAYNSLCRPTQGFPLVAGAASELLHGEAGPYIEAYLDLEQSAASSSSTYLTNPRTGLKDSPDAGTLISCSDRGAR